VSAVSRRITAPALLVVAALLATACSKAASKTLTPTTTSTTIATTTTAPPNLPTYPLTGLPMPNPASDRHPAVVVKMDNSPWARPQTGINQADIVFELLVEGITRYALVFDSNTPTTVGPVRSARSSDIDLLGGLGDPLLAWSGGNPTVMGQVSSAANLGLLIDASRGANPPEYWRDNSRQAPHNLYTNIPMLLAKFGPGDTRPPQAILPYAKAGTPLPAVAPGVAGVTVNFGDGVVVTYVWDKLHKGWARYQIDQLHDRTHSATLDTNGQQVAPPNVVVLFVHYGVSIADPISPQAYTVGSGTGFVYTEGRKIAITWARLSNRSPFSLHTMDGKAFGLPPGRTWVALAKVGSAVTDVDPGTAHSWLMLPN
jgi:Protein of unknown function (DUF3048) N-terminal domain/Protein of unknown function (DUF3048) C-terminal domain